MAGVINSYEICAKSSSCHLDPCFYFFGGEIFSRNDIGQLWCPGFLRLAKQAFEMTCNQRYRQIKP